MNGIILPCLGCVNKGYQKNEYFYFVRVIMTIWSVGKSTSV